MIRGENAGYQHFLLFSQCFYPTKAKYFSTKFSFFFLGRYLNKSRHFEVNHTYTFMPIFAAVAARMSRFRWIDNRLHVIV